jgi:acetyltransferase-like isoleucine patch superfamily enzyme
MKKITVALLCFFLPSYILRILLKIIGVKIGSNVKIGFSIIMLDKFEIHNKCKIGHFNFINIKTLMMAESSYIGHLNILRGPFSIVLKKRAAIGKNCLIRRSSNGVSYGQSQLILGELTKLTSNHFLDVTRSVTFGDFCTLAGIRSQLWTHGYVHATSGPDRFRVDGEIKIGNNVYIGSGVIINPGVGIADAINIGGNSTVSKSLTKPGMYVSQPLRYLDKDYDSIKASLTKVTEKGLIEHVFEKPI